MVAIEMVVMASDCPGGSGHASNMVSGMGHGGGEAVSLGRKNPWIWSLLVLFLLLGCCLQLRAAEQ